ncbi:hypothetical protein FHS14_006568 [Paenibacillus baekrokdamisoli]|nr:hypothetical protein [Paenibacillus baekrokdamisoli]MBB3073509.1 hypothetical protein [Paenibacillus baekrokdamisoli]
MMEVNKIKECITQRYPKWNVYIEPSGRSVWVSMNDGGINFFEVEVREEGVGITRRREVEEIDFSGHDEAFKDLEETFIYIDKNLIMK